MREALAGRPPGEVSCGAVARRLAEGRGVHSAEGERVDEGRAVREARGVPRGEKEGTDEEAADLEDVMEAVMLREALAVPVCV